MDTSTAKTTPKDFFLWAGAMVAFYWSVIALIGLLFDYINYTFPNPLAYYNPDPYQGGISFEMSSLIILVPLTVILMRIIRKNIETDPSRADIWVRRWALFLTLFIAGISMAGDLIWLLDAFLSGSEMTVAFLFKAAIVFLIAAAVFMHFLADFWGFWKQYPARATYVGIAAGLLVFAAIVSGFFIVGTPGEARTYRLDAQRVNDLQNVQYQITNFWQYKQRLPVSLAELGDDALSGFVLPKDPTTGGVYEYRTTGATSFELCATFAKESRPTTLDVTEPYMYDGVKVSEKWQHIAGRVCFTRTIDSELYPPIAKPTYIK